MALEQFKLDGQVAIVTGAGKGVGQGIARVLAEAGATVVGTARTQRDIEGTIADIENAGGRGLALVADAMSRPDGERVVNTAMERLGRIDILVQQRRRLDVCQVPGHHRRGLQAHLRLVRDLRLHHESACGTAHARGRTRLHREHLIGLGTFRNPRADGLLRCQGRARGTHAGHGAGARPEDSRQCHRPRFLRDRRACKAAWT